MFIQEFIFCSLYQCPFDLKWIKSDENIFKENLNKVIIKGIMTLVLEDSKI